MQKHSGIQPSNCNGGMDDLESFQTCLEEIKTTMSQEDPSLHAVLGEIVSSKQPIEEGDILQVFQSILRENHRTLRVFLAKRVRANFSEEEVHQLQPIDEYKPTEADKLRIKNEGIQLGCLLVQKTKGETQLPSHKMVSDNKCLGNLEATQLAVYKKQVEHVLPASNQHHERKL